MDDDLGPLRESARSPSQEKCASKCVRGIVLSAFIYFLARSDLNSEISNLKCLQSLNLKFEISFRMCG